MIQTITTSHNYFHTVGITDGIASGLCATDGKDPPTVTIVTERERESILRGSGWRQIFGFCFRRNLSYAFNHARWFSGLLPQKERR